MTICTPNPKDRVLFGLDRSADSTGRASDHALQQATKRRPPRLIVPLVVVRISTPRRSQS